MANFTSSIMVVPCTRLSTCPDLDEGHYAFVIPGVTDTCCYQLVKWPLAYSGNIQNRMPAAPNEFLISFTKLSAASAPS